MNTRHLAHGEAPFDQGGDTRQFQGMGKKRVSGCHDCRMQGPAKGHIQPGLLRSPGCRPASFLLELLKLATDVMSPEGAINERCQGSGVKPSKVHSLASDGADLVGGIAQQNRPAMDHSLDEP